MNRVQLLTPVVIASLGLARGAIAQETASVERSVEAQIFEPAVGPGGYFGVRGGGVLAHLDLDTAIYLGYQHNPLRTYRVYGDEMEPRTRVVSRQLSANLVAAIGLYDRFQLGFGLPATPYLAGNGLSEVGASAPDGLGASSGLGDLRLLMRARIAGNGEGLRVALAVPVTLPTGNEEAFMGESNVTIRPMLAVELRGTRVSGAVNIGSLMRVEDSEVLSSYVGDQLIFAAALSYRVAPALGLIAELSGRRGSSSDLDEAPLEALGGLRYQATRQLAITAGAGVGLIKGIGSPDYRGFAGLVWTTRLGNGDRRNLAQEPTLAQSDAAEEPPALAPAPEPVGPAATPDAVERVPAKSEPAEPVAPKPAPSEEVQGTLDEIAGQITFRARRRAKLEKRSDKAIERLAALLKEHPEITLLRIAVTPDQRGKRARKRARERAKVIRDSLIRAGVRAERLRAEGRPGKKAVRVWQIALEPAE